MVDAPTPARRTARLTVACVLRILPLWLVSCSSKPKIAGIPDVLPDIPLAGTPATPPHHMASYEYPFDSGGNYVAEWAAEGERRAGRSPFATSADEERWSSSHGGRVSGPSKVPASLKSKTVTSRSKTPTRDDSSPPKKKAPAGPSAATKAGATKYVVKKGDTVERIAARFHISVRSLMAANGMKSDFLRDGRVLKIPR
jgi:LysM repeat protein